MGRVLSVDEYVGCAGLERAVAEERERVAELEGAAARMREEWEAAVKKARGEAIEKSKEVIQRLKERHEHQCSELRREAEEACTLARAGEEESARLRVEVERLGVEVARLEEESSAGRADAEGEGRLAICFMGLYLHQACNIFRLEVAGSGFSIELLITFF